MKLKNHYFCQYVCFYIESCLHHWVHLFDKHHHSVSSFNSCVNHQFSFWINVVSFGEDHSFFFIGDINCIYGLVSYSGEIFVRKILCINRNLDFSFLHFIYQHGTLFWKEVSFKYFLFLQQIFLSIKCNFMKIYCLIRLKVFIDLKS